MTILWLTAFLAGRIWGLVIIAAATVYVTDAACQAQCLAILSSQQPLKGGSLVFFIL